MRNTGMLNAFGIDSNLGIMAIWARRVAIIHSELKCDISEVP